MTLDDRGGVVVLDAGAEEIFGSTGAAIVGKEVAELVFGGDGPDLLERRVELAARRGDGDRVVVELSVSRTEDEPARYRVVLREVAQPTALLPDRDRNDGLLRAARELANVGSWEWTPSEDQLLWSENLFRIFGLSPAELRPTPEYVLECTHPDDRQRVSEQVVRLGEEGELRPLEYRIIAADHSVRHLRATLAVAEERDGRPYRLVGWVQDVTGQRRVEREIAAHQAVTEALVDWDDFEPSVRSLLAGLATALDFQVGVLWVPDGDVLEAHTTWCSQPGDFPHFEAATLSLRLPRGVGFPGQAWERREPVVVRSLADTSLPRSGVAAEDGLHGAIAILAVAGDDVLAIVELVSTETAEPDERLMRSLTGIGHELGHFLDRRRADLHGSLLTPRELEVLQLAAHGLSARETAERLFVSPATVKTHLENIYPKLGVSDKPAAVATGMREGLIH